MKSTSLIFAAAAFCSLLPALQAEENYSLWPRRPAELEQARNMVRAQKYEEAVTLLRPFVGDVGIAGREARRIVSSINVRRYLTRAHPRASVVVVNRGDTMGGIVQRTGCPRDLIMMLNGMVEPSAIRVGQKLVVVRMDLRLEIHPNLREISVWDGDELVTVYDIQSMASPGGEMEAETTLAAREGVLKGVPVARRSADYPSSNRILRLANGWVLAGERQPEEEGAVLQLRQSDLNELGLLLLEGSRVSFVWDSEGFTPAPPAPAAVPPPGGGNAAS